jgi:membrane associated rhomboid family serine protease
LVIGVAMLMANNPSKRLPRLRNRELLSYLPLLLLVTTAVAGIGAAAGHSALPARWNDDFAEMLIRNEMRPRRFMTAYGIHLGGYLGGAVATVIAACRIRLQRRRKIELSTIEA